MAGQSVMNSVSRRDETYCHAIAFKPQENIVIMQLLIEKLKRKFDNNGKKPSSSEIVSFTEKLKLSST
jgi:hypothetical protein